MVQVAPTSFTAGKRIVLNGTTYQPGDTVPNAVAKTLQRLSALVSARFLIPNAKLTKTKGKLSTPTPSDIKASIHRAL